jgi:N6-L-threonylcarbamoyladenine synthase
MKILAIETSCDETSVAIIESLENLENKRIFKVLAHNTISQINIHAEYGGVYPALARREHEKNLVPLLHKSLEDAELLTYASQETLPINESGEVEEFLERYPVLKENLEDFFAKYSLNKKVDAIAVTSGPGLPPALWVGVNFAKVLSKYLETPIYPINHMEGHIIGGIAQKVDAPLLNKEELGEVLEIPNLNYPSLSFLISGGHTELVLSQEENDYQKIGETLDDAVGESYDKVARLLDLEYPGGPKLAELAKIGRAELEINKSFLKDIPKKFPRPLLHDQTLNFSFSGLKTHVLYLVNNLKDKNEGGLSENQKIQIATEFEETVREVFLKKLEKAILENNVKTVVLGGGVASNSYLRENFEKLAENLGVKIYISSKELSTDNALMIALTAAMHVDAGLEPTDNFNALGSLSF